MTDQFHCHCFYINPNDIKKCELLLRQNGFTDQVGGEEQHGQVFGLVKRLEEILQIHFKVMPDGNIEGEMEPPTAYPGAHTNPEHSYSAHRQIAEILRGLNIPHRVTGNIPITCIQPIIKKPVNPTHAAGFAVGLLALGVIGKLAYDYLKDKDDEEEDDGDEDDDEE